MGKKDFIVRSNLLVDANVAISGDISNVTSVNFYMDHIDSPTKGHICWNEDDSTLNIGLTDSNVVLQVGQETLVYAYNDTANTITNGSTVVKLTAQEGRLLIAPFIADGTYDSVEFLGVATEDIAASSNGYVTVYGYVRDFDTSSYSVGTILYASADTAGGYTDQAPTSPNLQLQVGTVTNQNNITGSIFVDFTRVPKASTVKYDNSGSNLIATNIQAAVDELQASKASVALLSSTITLYSTTTASDVSEYFILADSVSSNAYNNVATNVATGSITTSNQLVSNLIASPGLFVGNPGIISVPTIGNIRKTSGSGTATFYFELYKRSNTGVEELIGISNDTGPVDSAVYTQFTATALFNNGDWLATDRVVLKYYGSRIPGGSNPSYEFQFGGSSPVRTNIPVPVAVIPSEAANAVIVETSAFNNILSGDDDTVQKALETLDEHSHTTSEITEGSSLYYTVARANTAIDNRVSKTFIDSLGVVASSANTLTTPRTINGTNFDGSSDIITTSWGTSRTLTIGDTGKVVSGNSNVSWSLTEIGAADKDITLIAGDGLSGGGNLAANISFAVDATVVRTSGTQTIDGAKTFTNDITITDKIIHSGDINTSIRFPTANTVTIETAGAERVRVDSNGNVGVGTSSPSTTIEVNGTLTATNIVATSNGTGTAFKVGNNAYIGDVNTSDTLNVRGVQNSDRGYISFGDSSGQLGRVSTGALTWDGSAIFHDTYHPNADTWTTPRTLTIGDTGKSVNGSGNVSWSLTEIGAADRALTLTAGDGLSGGGNLTANRSFSVDSTVLRTTGDQDIGGRKTFTDVVTIATTSPTITLNDTTAGEDRFYIHVNSNNFYVLADRDGDGNWDSPHPLTLEADTNIAYAFASRIFTDSYHPNADTLTTPRTINGTNFDGSANITTANWGTTRTLTIGDTGKSVNGSANVSWSLTEIGAADRDLTLTAGDGLTGGGNLTTNRSFAVDSTVLRTTGTQTYSGSYIRFTINSGQTAGSATGGLAPLELFQPTNSTDSDAFMGFHIIGRHARYFGIDRETNDLFTGGWSAGANKYRVFHQQNILGSVSLSGGIPTGRIIESGSNANGYYVRFANGLQICTHVSNGDTGGAATWTYPSSFVSTAGLTVAISPGASAARFGTSEGVFTTRLEFSVYSVAGTRTAQAARLMAIGFWSLP